MIDFFGTEQKLDRLTTGSQAAIRTLWNVDTTVLAQKD